MDKLENATNYSQFAYFIGKALHGIATGKEFTVQDAKDATDAINAVGQLAMDEINEKEAAQLMRLLTDATKSTLDAISPAKPGSWGGKIVVPDNFNEPIDGFEVEAR